MKTRHSFGGGWTDKKLELLARYLAEYMKIFKNNPRAKYYTTYYIDGFAGTGFRQSKADPEGGLFNDIEAENFQKGSPIIALETDSPFDRYIFIETKKAFIKELEELRQSYPERSIEIVAEDSNEFLQRWCKAMNANKKRAVIFLDPYGGQVAWETIKRIADTRAIDLWLLFPLGQAVNRMLTYREPDPAWAKKLDLIFGTEKWRSEFYGGSKNGYHQSSLFGEEQEVEKCTSFQGIKDFFIKRLDSVFTAVAEPRPLYNGKNIPIYLLCFAAGNPKGATPAVKIANHLLQKKI